MSPYLEQDPRSLSEVVRHSFMSHDTYSIVALFDGLPYMLETKVGQTLNECVLEIAAGNNENAVGIVRQSMADCEFEDMTRKASLMVAQYIFEHADGPDDPLLNRPFLDRAWPRWKEEYMREWNAELAGMADARFYARTWV